MSQDGMTSQENSPPDRDNNSSEAIEVAPPLAGGAERTKLRFQDVHVTGKPPTKGGQGRTSSYSVEQGDVEKNNITRKRSGLSLVESYSFGEGDVHHKQSYSGLAFAW
jgi:hypothetical protein